MELNKSSLIPLSFISPFVKVHRWKITVFYGLSNKYKLYVTVIYINLYPQSKKFSYLNMLEGWYFMFIDEKKVRTLLLNVSEKFYCLSDGLTIEIKMELYMIHQSLCIS